MSRIERAPLFYVGVPDVALEVEDVWPDGDAPDNPTAADVAEVLRGSGHSIASIATEWNLWSEIEVTDNAGRTEIVR
jgi:hypothetical protein